MAPIPYSALFEVLELITAAVVSSSAVKGIWDVIQGLNAKYAAKRVLSHSKNARLLELSKAAKGRLLTEEEVKEASDIILESIDGLKKNDYARIREALRKNSKSGERRYVQELITARQ